MLSVVSDIMKYLHRARKSKHILVNFIVGTITDDEDEEVKPNLASAKLRDELQVLFEKRKKRREKLREKRGVKSRAAVKDINVENSWYKRDRRDRYGFKLEEESWTVASILGKEKKKSFKIISPTEKKMANTDMRELTTHECVNQSLYRKTSFQFDFGREAQEAGEPESE